MTSFQDFVSFPNYKPTLRINKVIFQYNYTRVEDVIRTLYALHYNDKHIRKVYSAFHESGHLIDTLMNVRACVIQLEPICCGFDKICILENTTMTVRSERVMYIRMYEFTGGTKRRCNDIQNAMFCVLLGLFAIVGLVLSIRETIDMVISS
jgi:hypothetical protein